MRCRRMSSWLASGIDTSSGRGPGRPGGKVDPGTCGAGFIMPGIGSG